jgi:hypothetical protein
LIDFDQACNLIQELIFQSLSLFRDNKLMGSRQSKKRILLETAEFTSVENHLLSESKKIDIRQETYYSDGGEFLFDGSRNYVFALKRSN